VGAELSGAAAAGHELSCGDELARGSRPFSRRAFLLAALASVAGPVAAAQCRRTPGNAPDPYYLSGQPQQADLCIRSGNPGLIVTGRVSAFPECRPVAGAQIEVWHADARGRYTRMDKIVDDDAACLLRGRVRTDDEGRYAFRTLVPGAHWHWPPRIHYRVSAPGYRTLATQMYLPPQKGVDPQLVARVLEPLDESGGGRIAFDLTLVPR
jgi:protocatechuate 3,4-dioxygenase beta subunit